MEEECGFPERTLQHHVKYIIKHSMSSGQRVKGDMDAQSPKATLWSPHGDELFGDPKINGILVEVHLTVN